MNQATTNLTPITTLGDKLTRLALALLLLATAYGVVVGAVITMYYDVTPDMGPLEDSLTAVPLILYILAVLVSLSHLPFALWDIKYKLWKQAIIRLIALIGPVIVFLGTEGVISHLLWWEVISDTDRFHMLHHALLAGVPLLLGYWLAIRWWWKPSAFIPVPPPSPKFWLFTGILIFMLIMALGILMGLVPPLVFGVSAIITLLAAGVIVVRVR